MFTLFFLLFIGILLYFIRKKSQKIFIIDLIIILFALLLEIFFYLIFNTFGIEQHFDIALPFWIIVSYLFLLCSIGNIIEKAVNKTWYEKDNPRNWKFFYDGNCPICSREVSQIEKRGNSQMNFININSDQFIKESGNLDYETAMTKMHAMDAEGNVISALDAFAVAYARSNWLFMATLLNIPFLRPLLDPFYKLFAKYRMFLTGRDNK